jgi:phosphate transport system ATP-binding protein
MNKLHAMQQDAAVSGRILLDGADLSDHGLSLANLRRRIGMVFPVPTPLPMSVRGNIAFALRQHGRPGRAAVAKTVEDVLTRVGLWRGSRVGLNRHAATLGHGEQQLLCVARALAIGAEILLLDDPTQTLDPAETERLEVLLGDLKSDITIIMATSQLPLAARCADRIVLMQDGLVVEAGSPVRLLTGAREPLAVAYLAGQMG